MMNRPNYAERAVYYPERAAYEKIAEWRAAAAREWLAVLAVKTDRARLKARQTAGSPLARLLRSLASTFRCRGQALGGTVPGPNAR
jgi:hypothetical protein